MEHVTKQKIIKPYRESNFTRKNSSPFFSSGIIQPKLTINQPNDIYKQEADAVAEKVMRMPAPGISTPFFTPKPLNIIQRECSQCAEEENFST